MRPATLIPLLSIFSLPASAETFEALSYTPPSGWTVQNSSEGKVYVGRQPNGPGTAIIAVYASQPGSSTAQQAFAAYWRLHMERAMPGAPPEPTVAREGDYAFAAGSRQAVNAQGVPMNAVLVAFSGRGRTFGAMGVATGEELSRAVSGFFGSLRLAGTAAPGQAAPSEAEIDFDVPPGYTAGREGRNIVLSPVSNDKRTPCTYIIGPPRPSKGSLDADAEAALLEAYPGWQRMDDRRRIMKGTSATGWPYFWNRADVWEGPSAFSNRALAMAMTLPAGGQRVHVVLGRGGAFCTFDDASFARLLTGLRPRGWASDGGKALARDLLGTWRWTNGYSAANAMMQYTFQADGRFVLDSGSATQIGVTQTTATNVRGGRYTWNGSEIVLIRDTGERRAYRIRIYDELGLGGWKRVLSMVDERENAPAPVEYYRVD